MQKLIYKGHDVEIYDGYDGDQLFITKDGQRVYSARVNKGMGMDRVKSILG